MIGLKKGLVLLLLLIVSSGCSPGPRVKLKGNFCDLYEPKDLSSKLDLYEYSMLEDILIKIEDNANLSINEEYIFKINDGISINEERYYDEENQCDK